MSEALPVPIEEDESGRGGKRPGAGRTPGTITKRSLSDILNIKDVLASKNYDPIGELVDIARQEGQTQEKREQIAKDILPYVYSKRPMEAAPASDDGEEGEKSFSFKLVL